VKGWQKLLCRAGVVSGISTISILIRDGFPPTYETGYFALLTFILGLLVFIRTAWDNDDEDGDGETEEKESPEKAVKVQLEKCKKVRSGKILGFIPNLWFP
jgi:hypothetical protein